MTRRAFWLLGMAICLATPLRAGETTEEFRRWTVRFDLGGNIPENPALTLYDGPVTGGDDLELAAGFQMDLAVGFRLAPWLKLEGEMGMSFNEVESVGNWSYPNSSLSQLALMANVVVERPKGPLVPFAGFGAGGVFSTLSFGEYYYYYYNSADGYGSDAVPAVQVFAGLKYEFSPQMSLGVSYRCLATDRQKWDVEWWNGADFDVGVESFLIHSICLTFTGSF